MDGNRDELEAKYVDGFIFKVLCFKPNLYLCAENETNTLAVVFYLSKVRIFGWLNFGADL